MKNTLILIALLLALFSCKAQLPPGEYTSKNKKAVALFEQAMKLYNQQKDDECMATLTKAIEKDSNFIEPHLLMAELYQIKGNNTAAIKEYEKAITISPGFSSSNFYNIARLEMKVGDYKNAKSDFERFLKNPNINPDSRESAERNVENCTFAIEATKNPKPFKPVNLGEGINSNLDEYFPAITADDQTFLFTRNNRTERTATQEDFMVSKKVGGVWQKAMLIPGTGINTQGNEGAPSLSVDGQVLFFTVCQDQTGSFGPGRKGLGGCDIFYAEKVGDAWSKPYNLGNSVNTQYRETQPSFSADGKSLYFVSNRPGGMGEHDIYVSELDADGSWKHPVNLGKKVNSKGDEQSVFIHPDGRTLYFSSNGRIGMGGFDIYVVRKDAKGVWGEPVNLGYPINTYGDENSLLVGASGEIAYFASNRDGGLGGLDMYKFDLYKEARPDLVTYVKGKVYDVKSREPLGAHFVLIDLATGKPVIESDANSGNGEFLVTLPVDKDYLLNVSQPGYLFYSENFALKELADKTKPFIMDVPMQPIDTGIIELKNVFFETAKFNLKPESNAELDILVKFLNVNKTIRGELSGHTDNVGDKKSNMTLSQNRAKTVYDYLVAHGIDPKRLTYKGYGDTRPKVKNDSDANRAINRRTEFKVIGK
ncbi:MAG: OmpA/MotB domain protein [Bacteroidetes bacterium]|nr:OmpA/MotB domain protein [Bacteroidota bacterium]